MYKPENVSDVEYMDYCFDKLNDAESTSGRRYWFNKMVEMWTNNDTIKKIWEYVADAFLMVKRFVKRTVEKVVNPRRTANVIFADGVQEMNKGTEQFYLIRLFDGDNNLIWSKIGTTARKTWQRMTEHLRAYKKNGIEKIIVDAVWDCAPYQAEMVESDFRAYYMKKYPGTWKKNDRFCGVEFDLAEARKHFEMAMGI